MTLRLKIILTALISVTVLVVGFGAYRLYVFISKTAKQAQPTQDQPITPQEKNSFFDEQKPAIQAEEKPSAQVTSKSAQSVSDERTRADLLAFALPFAERFGSYSNQSNFENLSDLMPFMSESMRSWAKEKINSAKNTPTPTLYKGTTTKAISHTVLGLDTERETAEIRVTTQRKELVGTSANFKVYNQDLLLNFVKEDGTWLVNSAVWQ